MSNNAGYDKALLDDAPEVTPQQRQRFYDADLLYDDANRDQQWAAGDSTVAPPPSGAAAPDLGRSNTDIEAGHGASARRRSKEYAPLPPPSTRKSPWYKTRTGIIALAILAIVIIGAVVGGAVGGTQANKNKNKSASDEAQTGGSSSASVLPPSLASSSTSGVSQTIGVGTDVPGPSTNATSSVTTTSAAESGFSPATGGQSEAGTNAVAIATDSVETSV